MTRRGHRVQTGHSANLNKVMLEKMKSLTVHNTDLKSTEINQESDSEETLHLL